MRYIKVLLFLSVITCCCIGIFFFAGRRRFVPDIMLQNDITETVKENINDLTVLSSKYPDMEILVFDVDGFCVYPKGRTETLTDVRGDGNECLAVADDDRFLGTVTIPNAAAEEYKRAFNGLTAAAVILFLLMIGAAGAFYIYLRKRVLVPFDKMKSFAGRVAMGDLDSPLEMQQDNMFGAFTESFDIMREELKASRQRENELKRKEKELVAQLSHDLKTPITGINTICDVMSVKIEDEYMRGKIEGIQSKTEQMENLVNDLLTSTLDDIGEMTVNCTDERSGVLKEIVAASDPKGVVREENIPECMIRVDMKRMPQVIGNIIANSYKYAGTAIDIGYSITGDYLKMTISDHGPGVPAEELDLITNKFYRGEGVKESEIEGSGLGLYTASTLMAKMHGELICSSKGEGLTVTLMILLSK
jgi:signal transduction histidine kinase